MLFLSLATLFLSAVLLQFGVGALAPLDALSGLHLDFTATQIGLLGSAHFIGFFVGCWGAPRLMGSVGHSRTFAAFAAAGTIGTLAHMLIIHPHAWAVMRLASGMCMAGCYTVIEAWLQAKVTNQTRGRAMGLYRVTDIGGSLGAQLFIGFLEPASFVAYNLLAILCCAALFPLTLTRDEQPPVPEAPRLRPRMAWDISPLAAVSVVCTGITGGAFRMVGPVYGAAIGLSADRLALFLAAYVAGGAAAQLPVGWLADRIERRKMMTGLAGATIVSCLLMLVVQTADWRWVFAGAFLFGFCTFPLYSVAAAHSNDLALDTDRVELSAALMFLYALGAIASPYVSSAMIAAFGPGAMFVFLAVVNAGLVGFAVYRMLVTPGHKAPRTGYTYLPRTSFTIGRLLGRGKDPE